MREATLPEAKSSPSRPAETPTGIEDLGRTWMNTEGTV